MSRYFWALAFVVFPRGALHPFEANEEPNTNAIEPTIDGSLLFGNNILSPGGQRGLGMAAHVEDGVQTGNDH